MKIKDVVESLEESRKYSKMYLQRTKAAAFVRLQKDNFVESKKCASVARREKFLVVKLLRAHEGCLGTERRRRTW